MKNERLFEDTKARMAELEEVFYSISGEKPKVPLYAPHELATDWMRGSSNMAIEPAERGLQGRLSSGELMALLIVHQEVKSLTRRLEFDNQGQFSVCCLLGLEEDSLMTIEVLNGMAEFLRNLSYAAGIRERVIREEERPADVMVLVGYKNLAKDQEVKEWRKLAYLWNRFGEAVVEDRFLLGQAVCLEATNMVVENTRWGGVEMSRKVGAEMAASLYLALLASGPEEFVKKGVEEGK